MKRLFLLTGLLILLSSGSKAQSLVHYWNFNNSTTQQDLLTPTNSQVNGASIQHIAGGTSAIQITSNTAQGFEVNNPNARNGDPSATHLRFNEPIGGALLLSLPTTGFRDVVLTYATRRSGQGAGSQYIEYSTDGSTFNYFDTIFPPDGNPATEVIDFSSITAANNNPNFQVRITFSATGGGTGGNNRFDNLTLDGNPTSGDVTAPALTFLPANGSTRIAANVQPFITFNEDVRLVNNTALDNTNADAVVELRLDNASGSPVPFDATISGRVITLTPNAPLLPSQTYYVALLANTVEDLSDNAVSSTESATFTTLSAQTVFQPGDLVPVAYRMNATATDDEFAVLTLVNILPGTLINFTDAKYTDNAQPQCAGGFTWEAPASGVAAGTVIQIKNDANPPVPSIGSAFGSGFGLSSSGDQVIVYTGSAAAPSFITALSANAWLSSNSSCSGSSSKLPATLTDGTSSINLSTAPGNVSGLTVNAYYAGTQQGTPSQLRAAILDPANWIGVGASTAPQTWPTWAFPGPPTVISARVLNQQSIQLVFSRDLADSSATNPDHYTGISGLNSVQRSNNGALADTLVLTFSAPFTSGQSFSLQVAGVFDTEGRSMFSPYTFNFTYQTTLSWSGRFTVKKENDATAYILPLNVQFPANATVELNIKNAPWSTATAADISQTNTTITIDGTTSQLSIPVSVINDALAEQDEYLVFALENEQGLTISGSRYFTLYIQDDDRPAPVPSKDITLKHLGSFDPSGANNATTEIVAYDPASRRLFATSAIQDRLDIIDFSNPAAPSTIKTVDLSPYGGITSVAVKNGTVAVASPNADNLLEGSVVFLNTNGDFLKQVTVGVLPDMVVFTPDGKKVMTANEGQPNDAYTVDPEGSVSIIDISGGIAGLTQNNVKTLLFTQYNSQESALISAGVRKLKSNSTLSQDFEPEYITISDDSKKAWVTLQENNAVAEIDLVNDQYTSVWPLGTKNLSSTGNGIDASDRSGQVIIANWNIKAFLIPDAIASYSVNGRTYLVTANEGDEKEYGGLNERTTVADANLDPAVYPNAAMLKEEHALGRLRITNLYGNTGGIYQQLHVVGGRSFSIFDAGTQSLVYDSGDDFEKYTSTDTSVGNLFNADNENNTFKSRSRAKGPEPEGVCVAKIAGRNYAFISLERTGGVMAYDVTDPAAPFLVDYRITRSKTSYSGDHGPEGIIHIPASESPNGKPLVIVANEISGTLSIFEIEGVQAPASVNFAQSTQTVAENIGAVNVSLQLTAPAAEASAVYVRLTDGPGLVRGTDYTSQLTINGDSIRVNIAKGATSAVFTINVADDNLSESTESLTLTLGSIEGYLNPGNRRTFVLSITDNDPNSLPEHLGNEALTLYPNPGRVGEALFTLNHEATFVITDVNGKEIYRTENSTRFDAANWPAGIYFLRSTDGQVIRFSIR